MKKLIVIHLGFPKTGSTTIQSMLALNRDLLSPFLHVSPKDNLTYKLRKNALRFMRSNHFIFWKYRYKSEISKFVNRVKEIDSNCIIISDENMTGIESGKLFEPGIAEFYAKWLNEFDSYLCDFNVQYVVYTREPNSWRKSSYNQAVKMRRVKTRFENWVLQNNDLDGPEKIIAKMREYLGDRLHVFDMNEDILNNQFIGANILKIAGVDSKLMHQIVVPSPQNQSLSQAALEFISLVNESNRLSSFAKRAVVHIVKNNIGLFNSKNVDK